MPEKAPISSVQFRFLQQSADPKDRQKLKAFIRAIFKKEKVPLQSLVYIFCSDKYLLNINQQFLQHNFYTDTISFNLAAQHAPVQGEIYVSLDRVKDNARQLKQYYYMELHRVIFHGALHLCGYKDKIVKDVRIMRTKEDNYLGIYFNMNVPRITVSG